MAWNGRNESILGAKPATNDAPSIASSKDDDSRSEAAEAKKPVPAPVPKKSVWNGRHEKIMEISDKSKDPGPSSTPVPGSEASSVVSMLATPLRSPSPSVASVLSETSKKDALVVGAYPKDDAKVMRPAAAHAKEDETTNSTAGSSRSSTTNGTSAADRDHALEVKEVVTTTAVAPEPEKKDASKADATSEGAKKANVAAAAGSTGRSNGGGGGNRQGGGQANNATSNGGGGASGSRRAANNKGRGNAAGNNNSGTGGGGGGGNNNNARNNSRGSGGGGSGRRRANNAATSDRPVCTFFLRGICNRGTACAFRHDPVQAPPAQANAPPRRSGSHPPSKGGSGPSMPSPGRGPGFGPSKRVFDPYKARAIQLAKDAQDKEDRSFYASPKRIPGEARPEEPPFFSIDVECVATGYGSCAKGINDGCGNEGSEAEGAPSYQYNERSHRYPGRVAVVDSSGELLADILVRPPKDGAGVVSYLTPLTGLTPEMCLGPDAKTLEEAVAAVKALLSPDCVLVGQAIDHDVEWLGLVEGRDFGRMLDISVIFRQRTPAALGAAADALKARDADGTGPPPCDDPSSDAALGFATKYRHFSLRHVCLNLLGTDIQSGVHDPVVDAMYSLALFRKYRDSSVTQLRIVKDGLHRAPITPGFAAENAPVIDGVCVSAAGYPYKRAARRIWRWYLGRRQSS